MTIDTRTPARDVIATTESDGCDGPRAVGRPTVASRRARAETAVQVLGGFDVCVAGRPVAVPANVERVLAFLALRARRQQRATVASMLWLDSPQERAAANLRTALWKARSLLGDCIDSRGAGLALQPGVDVDLDRVVERARRLIDERQGMSPADDDPRELFGDLLPDWDDDWVLFERERLRQLRIHALESLCRRLVGFGRTGEAIDAGLAAVAAEPLRESAQRVLIAAHLSEGNVCEARRQYQLYRDVLWDGLGIEPSNALRVLVGLA